MVSTALSSSFPTVSNRRAMSIPRAY